jgi:hypothetical protein
MRAGIDTRPGCAVAVDESARVFALVLRVALVIGFCIDFFVGLLCVVAQPLLQPLLDIPVKDPAVTTIAGGELIVASVIYALVLRDGRRWQPLLWLCALDQFFGVILPAIEIARGHAPATLKTLGPMPLQAILIGCYLAGARRGRPVAT